jgi:uncharacterized phage protein (TIGR01671 family)
MSREIKFRVWDKNENDIVRWELLNDGIIDLYHLFFSKDENLIIQQFTGLKDINGKEIYEGDICKHNNDIAVIVFWEGAFIFNKYYTHNNSLTNFACIRTFEIIGNIYETPELLQS